MAKQVTLNLKSLQTAVAELEQIKSQVTAHAGTQATRLAAAREAVIDSVVVKFPAWETDEGLYHGAVEYAEAILAEAKQALDEAVTAHLRQQKDAGAESLSALRESFASKKEAADAMRNLLVQLGIDGAEDVTVPTLKGTGRVGTGGTKRADSKGQQFYRIVDGTRVDQASSQNKFSSMAWYYGAAILGLDKGTTNNGRGVTAPELTKFLESKGVTVTAGTPWSFQVSPDFTIGMDVSETEAASDDAADDEAPTE